MVNFIRWFGLFCHRISGTNIEKNISMTKKFIPFLTFFFFFICALYSQSIEQQKHVNIANQYYQKNKSNIDSVKSTSYQQNKIDLLSEAYWEKKKNLGYRIQIYSGKSRWEATKVKSDFISKHGDETEINLVYQAPNFKLRIGNYRERIIANKHLNKIKETHPSAFLVKDEISIPKKLIKNRH